jgi:hypothetical protein
MPIAPRVPTTVAVIADAKAMMMLLRNDPHKFPELKRSSPYHLNVNPDQFMDFDALKE